MAGTSAPRVLAVADSDSYLKWSAATLDRLPTAWSRRQLLITSPITPSTEQAAGATGRPIETVSVARLRREVRRNPPDVLLLACTGPTTRVLAGLRPMRGPHRPVLVTGLPGISVPASARAVDRRRGCDLLVVHSRREQHEFSQLAGERAPGLQVALSHLPFLIGHRAIAAPAGTDLVFAAQAKVPQPRTQREAILLALAEVEPRGSAVVKVRALAGEHQTHREDHPYPALWTDLVSEGRVAEDAVRFQPGPMGAALQRARGLVTVSSTAALEAIDRGVPVVVLSDFGVGPALINEVFRSSGCLGTLADVRAGRAYRPDPEWLTENYFHADGDDLTSSLEALVARRRAGTLVDRPRDRAVGSLASLRALGRLLAPESLIKLARRRQRRR